MAELPTFDELLARDDGPAGSSWGLWGPDDVLGCLNLLTPERAVRGAGLVRRGRVFPLNLELELPDPPLFRRVGHRHDVVWLRSGNGHDDSLSDWNPQRSSQWDGFRHIRSRGLGFYNGVDDEAHGIHHWARRGIVTRGVLADVARWRATEGRPIEAGRTDIIEPEDLTGCLAAQQVEVEPGDVLLIRTGWLTWYRTLDAPERAAIAADLATCGLRSGRPSARLLWDLHVAAVAADNPGLEAMPVPSLDEAATARLVDRPGADGELFLHPALLPLLGLPIGELWDLDALADDCADDRRYDFLLTSAPLNLHQGVGTSANALAVK